MKLRDLFALAHRFDQDLDAANDGPRATFSPWYPAVIGIHRRAHVALSQAYVCVLYMSDDDEHTAVIIAEDITSRFMNVISLLHGAIPLVAIKMEALEHNGEIGLHFTKVLEPIALGSDDEEGAQSATDRAYWEARGSKVTVHIADELAEITKSLGIPIELKYNKYYIGVTLNGAPENFIIFRPKRTFARLEPRLTPSDALRKRYEDAGLNLMSYDQRWGRFRIELHPGDVAKHKEILSEIIKEAYENHIKE